MRQNEIRLEQIMKKILLGVFIFILIISCGENPETVVSKFIDNVKEKKFDEASKYSVNKDFTKDLKLEYNNKMQQLFFETLFKNIKYEIVGKEKQGDVTIITVSVENVDTQKVFMMIFQKLLKDTFPQSTTPPIEEEFKKVLESKEVPKAKNVTKFVVVKTKEGNKINVTAENIDVLFGKLNTTLANLNTLGTDGEEENDNENQILQEGPNAGKDQKLTEPKLDKK
jgi:putative liporotein